MRTLGSKIIIWASLLMLSSAQIGASAEIKEPNLLESGISGVTVWTKAQRVQCFIDVAAESGAYVTTVESSADGQFIQKLKPGIYVLTPYWLPSGDPLSNVIVGGPSVMVRVNNGHLTRVKLSLGLN